MLVKLTQGCYSDEKEMFRKRKLAFVHDQHRDRHCADVQSESFKTSGFLDDESKRYFDRNH
jgi:hypothetical protein